MAEVITVALVGNPNTGKSTLFTALSGVRQHVGNYPGVTVEVKIGETTAGTQRLRIIDLPGTYSLAPRSPDEMVAVNLLLGRDPNHTRPDVIISVVDACNLERHLYLTSQLCELGIPVVLAVNMVDLAKRQGIVIDYAKLEHSTGLRVVPIQANRGQGVEFLKEVAVQSAADGPTAMKTSLPDAIHVEIQKLQQRLPSVPEYILQRLLLDVGGYVEQSIVAEHGQSLNQLVQEARKRLASAGQTIPGAEAKARFGWVRQITAGSISRPEIRKATISDRLDRVLTHRIWGVLIFFGLMFLVFQAIYVGAEPPKEWIEQGTSSLSSTVESVMSPGPLRSLIVDGVIAGVGGVVIFLPQILILFAFISFLEDCGYMARAAYLMDRIMSRCGLSGKSFIPLLSSLACAVPGIMATRVIEQRKDRIATILVAPLMSCSARLPVYSLLIGAFLTDGYAFWVPGLTLFAMYMIGFIVAPLVAMILKRTLLRGEKPIFIMELPSYKWPSIRTLARRVFDAAWAFIYRAGTIIMASMILIWALLYFPDRNHEGRYLDQLNAIQERINAINDHTILIDDEMVLPDQLQEQFRALEDNQRQIKGYWKRNRYLGQMGRAMEPVFRPLGWDWKIGMATLASFPAREVIVGTLAIIYEANDSEEDTSSLQSSIQRDIAADPNRMAYAVPVALSVMVFFALCCQCASTLAIIRRETNSWYWPTVTFAYMTLLAYIAALVTYQTGRLICDYWNTL